jgi:hypothetical protein
MPADGDQDFELRLLPTTFSIALAANPMAGVSFRPSAGTFNVQDSGSATMYFTMNYDLSQGNNPSGSFTVSALGTNLANTTLATATLQLSRCPPIKVARIPPYLFLNKAGPDPGPWQLLMRSMGDSAAYRAKATMRDNVQNNVRERYNQAQPAHQQQPVRQRQQVAPGQ